MIAMEPIRVPDDVIEALNGILHDCPSAAAKKFVAGATEAIEARGLDGLALQIMCALAASDCWNTGKASGYKTVLRQYLTTIAN